MKCAKIQKLIPPYLEEELQPNESKLVTEHLKGCALCQKEKALFAQAWDLLPAWEDIQPSSDYISRFWTELSLREPWYARAWNQVKALLVEPRRRWAPALAALCLIAAVSILTFHNYRQIEEPEALLAGLNATDLEMMEYMELAENYEMLENLEFLEDLDIIEDLDTLEDSEINASLES